MEEQKTQTKILEMRDIAAKLGISAATCRQWAVAGLIPVFRYNNRGRWRAVESDIDKYLADRRSSPPTGAVEGASQ